MTINLAHSINYIIARHMRSIDFIVHRLFDVNCQGSDLIARYMISLEGYLCVVLLYTFRIGWSIYAHPPRSNRLIWVYRGVNLIFHNIIKALGIIPPTDYFPDNVTCKRTTQLWLAEVMYSRNINLEMLLLFTHYHIWRMVESFDIHTHIYMWWYIIIIFLIFDAHQILKYMILMELYIS